MSRTSDPREGFFTYVFLENNYRDWPWMALDGDWLIVSHHGNDDPAGPVSSLISLADMRVGRARPEYIHYFGTDLQGFNAEPPRQLGTLPSHSLLVGQDATRMAFFALPHPVQPYGKKAAGWKFLNGTTYTDYVNEFLTYRKGMLYLAKQVEVSGKKEIRLIRLYLSLNGDEPVYSTAAGDGYKMWNMVGTTGQDLEAPITAVNGAGEVFMVWSSHGRDPADEIAPSVRHAIWRPAASWFDATRTFRSGDGYASGTSESSIKARAAAVDPVDDRTFWAIHRYGTSAGNWGIVVGSVNPLDQ